MSFGTIFTYFFNISTYFAPLLQRQRNHKQLKMGAVLQTCRKKVSIANLSYYEFLFKICHCYVQMYGQFIKANNLPVLRERSIYQSNKCFEQPVSIIYIKVNFQYYHSLKLTAIILKTKYPTVLTLFAYCRSCLADHPLTVFLYLF